MTHIANVRAINKLLRAAGVPENELRRLTRKAHEQYQLFLRENELRLAEEARKEAEAKMRRDVADAMIYAEDRLRVDEILASKSREFCDGFFAARRLDCDMQLLELELK